MSLDEINYPDNRCLFVSPVLGRCSKKVDYFKNPVCREHSKYVSGWRWEAFREEWHRQYLSKGEQKIKENVEKAIWEGFDYASGQEHFIPDDWEVVRDRENGVFVFPDGKKFKIKLEEVKNN